MRGSTEDPGHERALTCPSFIWNLCGISCKIMTPTWGHKEWRCLRGECGGREGGREVGRCVFEITR